MNEYKMWALHCAVTIILRDKRLFSIRYFVETEIFLLNYGKYK